MHLNDSLDMGGAEVMIFSLLSNMNKGEYCPSVCSMSSGGALNEMFSNAGIPIYEIPQRNGKDWSLVFRLAICIKRNKINILHTHNYYSWLYGGIACLFVSGCVQVHTQHSNIIMKSNPPKFIRWLLAGIPRAVIAVSEQVKTSLNQRKYIRDNFPVSVVVNGVDVSKYSNKVYDSNYKKQDCITIGIVARLSEVKNHKLLLNAFSNLATDITKSKLTIVGNGPLMTMLKQYAEKLDISDNVIFLGEVSNIPELLKGFDIFVLPSLSEGLSIAILEAMSAYLPVIATDVGGNRSLVDNDVTGLIVESENKLQLTQALELLISDESLRLKMGINGRKKVEKNFALGKMVSQYQDIYKIIM